MRTTAPTLLARALPALALAATVATGGTSAPVILAATETAPSFAAPGERAAALGLPAPAARDDAQHRQCAADVTGQYPTVCFPAPADADDYISGRARRADGTQAVTLSGSGGTGVATTGAETVGRTCSSSGCTGATTVWFSPSRANCTHGYPANDYYREYVPAFYYAQNYGATTLNCNRMVMYRDNTQGGYLLNDCGSSTAVCGPGGVAYRSISWHNG